MTDTLAADPPKPFRTDGCSMWPEGPWSVACIRHDKLYWRGGTAKERLMADVKMRDEIAAMGYPKIAWLMYRGVRIGGHPWLPTPWRWGYGWEWPRSGS